MRREPQPPIPIVVPLSSEPTISSTVVTFDAACATGITPLGDEGVAVPVARAHQVELEGEALLETVAAVDVDRVDAVQRLLGAPDDVGVLGGDLGRDRQGGLAEPVGGRDLQDRAEGVQLGGGDGAAGVDHGAHQVLGDQAGQVGGGPERAALHLGQAEVGVLGGDHDVGVAGQADAAAQAEPVHGRDHRDLALVDGRERGVAAPVRPHQRLEPGGGLHLLDVHPGVEAPALRAQHHDAGLRIAPGLPYGPRQVEPALDGQRVDRGHVRDDFGDAVAVVPGGDSHAIPFHQTFVRN
nr:hypothetical protein GCM10020093_012560 [Planobispora longispora]